MGNFIKRPEVFGGIDWKKDNLRELEGFAPKFKFEITDNDILSIIDRECNDICFILAIGDVLVKSLLTGQYQAIDKVIFANQWMPLSPPKEGDEAANALSTDCELVVEQD